MNICILTPTASFEADGWNPVCLLKVSHLPLLMWAKQARSRTQLQCPFDLSAPVQAVQCKNVRVVVCWYNRRAGLKHILHSIWTASNVLFLSLRATAHPVWNKIMDAAFKSQLQFQSCAVSFALHTLHSQSCWWRLTFLSSGQMTLFQASSLRPTGGLYLVVNPLRFCSWSLLSAADRETCPPTSCRALSTYRLHSHGHPFSPPPTVFYNSSLRHGKPQ